MRNSIPAALSDLDPAKVEAAIAKMAPFGDSDPYFQLWLRLVDRRISAKIGLGMDDIEDAPYWDMYDSGLSPREAAQEALENSDTFGFLAFE